MHYSMVHKAGENSIHSSTLSGILQKGTLNYKKTSEEILLNIIDLMPTYYITSILNKKFKNYKG